MTLHNATKANKTQPELRITTGSAKNKRLKAPSIEGFRAVQEVAKSALFSILGEKVVDTVCLDLFAGSGNLGLEALSRGAAWCDFVDGNGESILAIVENIKNCEFGEKAATFLKDAAKYVATPENNYDIVFMDPFYKDTAHIHLFKLLPNILNDDAVVFFFHSPGLEAQSLLIESDLHVVDERRFGASVLSILRI